MGTKLSWKEKVVVELGKRCSLRLLVWNGTELQSWRSLNYCTATEKANREMCNNSQNPNKIISISQLLWFFWKGGAESWGPTCWEKVTAAGFGVFKLCFLVAEQQCHSAFPWKHTWKTKQSFGKTPELHSHVQISSIHGSASVQNPLCEELGVQTQRGNPFHCFYLVGFAVGCPLTQGGENFSPDGLFQSHWLKTFLYST